MIVGIGTDLTEIGRIRQACAKESFCRAVFTERERAYAGEKVQSFAAMFAAKEAAAKALGTGFTGFGPLDIEVGHTEQGAPYLTFRNGAAARLAKIGGGRSFLSLSHEKEQAIAFVVIEGQEEDRFGQQRGTVKCSE